MKPLAMLLIPLATLCFHFSPAAAPAPVAFDWFEYTGRDTVFERRCPPATTAIPSSPASIPTRASAASATTTTCQFHLRLLSRHPDLPQPRPGQLDAARPRHRPAHQLNYDGLASHTASSPRPSVTTTARSTSSARWSTPAATSSSPPRIPPARGPTRSGWELRRHRSLAVLRRRRPRVAGQQRQPARQPAALPGHRAIWIQEFDPPRRNSSARAPSSSTAASTSRRSPSGSRARISTSATAGIISVAPRAARATSTRRSSCAASRSPARSCRGKKSDPHPARPRRHRAARRHLHRPRRSRRRSRRQLVVRLPRLPPFAGKYWTTGRETFLLPVRWTDDGWPQILPPGERVPYEGNPRKNALAALDHAPRAEGNLVEPRPTPGHLALTPRADRSPARATHHSSPAACSTRASTPPPLSLVPADIGVSAGLAVFQNENHYYYLGVRRTAAPSSDCTPGWTRRV
jgi:xylan 1,4-beta-xylosidase